MSRVLPSTKTTPMHRRFAGDHLIYKVRFDVAGLFLAISVAMHGCGAHTGLAKLQGHSYIRVSNMHLQTDCSRLVL